MTNLTTAITEIKSKISMQEWEQRKQDCQSSGKSVKAWCLEIGISAGSYYYHLRKIRESVLEEHLIVPLDSPKAVSSAEIRIESEWITVALSGTATPEQLTAVLAALAWKFIRGDFIIYSMAYFTDETRL